MDYQMCLTCLSCWNNSQFTLPYIILFFYTHTHIHTHTHTQTHTHTLTNTHKTTIHIPKQKTTIHSHTYTYANTNKNTHTHTHKLTKTHKLYLLSLPTSVPFDLPPPSRCFLSPNLLLHSLTFAFCHYLSLSLSLSLLPISQNVFFKVTCTMFLQIR